LAASDKLIGEEIRTAYKAGQPLNINELAGRVASGLRQKGYYATEKAIKHVANTTPEFVSLRGKPGVRRRP
jgi:hypothetical protein